jgi:deoxyhypusine monooxygenase
MEEVSVPVSEDQVIKLGEFLKNENNPLKARFRALFTLRNIKTPSAIQQIGLVFSDPSALLKHELAYCLGQMQSEAAVPILSSVLSNLEEHPMVRHEAGMLFTYYYVILHFLRLNIEYVIFLFL